MNIRPLGTGLATLLLMISTAAMSEEMTLEEAKAEVERLEQENLSLKEKLEANEQAISEYKDQMAGIEAEIAELQAQLEQ
ncbi:MAG: hypothetical protein R3318_04205 [Gammaproteobacteria bacterium]|nr:hypothetical protein [Gammaproteobacteria bacterium]